MRRMALASASRVDCDLRLNMLVVMFVVWFACLLAWNMMKKSELQPVGSGNNLYKFRECLVRYVVTAQ
jgi:hypothetical protein